MATDFWRHRRRRRKYRPNRYRNLPAQIERFIWQIHPLLLMLAVGIVLYFGLIHTIERRMRPIITSVAQVQIHNKITKLLEETVAQDLENRQFNYENFMSIQHDKDGKITALTTDMARINLFRNSLMERILLEMEHIDSEMIQIPVGSLVDSEMFWGKGPSIKVRTVTAGTVSAEFESEFSDAGVNQTLHKIWLTLSIPVKILLPGSRLESNVETRICVAETVIVGQVPNLYQKANQ